MNNIKDTQNRLDIDSIECINEQQEPCIKILRLWKTKMLAININDNKEEIYTIDGFTISNYQKENRTSVVINVDNMKGHLSFVLLNGDIKTIDGKFECELPSGNIGKSLMSNADMQSLKASCINIYIELLQDAITPSLEMLSSIKIC
jgi:hypothetical protein